jgi:hypothetical protein
VSDEPVSLGSVVRDSRGRIGIVCSKEPTPSSSWIDEQVDSDWIKRLGSDVRWWGVMPLDGGYLLCPEPDVRWLRSATYDDFLVAVDHAGGEGRVQLAGLFPDYVVQAAEALAKRASQE